MRAWHIHYSHVGHVAIVVQHVWGGQSPNQILVSLSKLILVPIIRLHVNIEAILHLLFKIINFADMNCVLMIWIEATFYFR